MKETDEELTMYQVKLVKDVEEEEEQQEQEQEIGPANSSLCVKYMQLQSWFQAHKNFCPRNWQVGQGSTEDQLSPCYVAAMGGLHVVGVAAGLWHTLCITDVGDVYAFGGNQFGQLGVGGTHAEVCFTIP